MKTYYDILGVPRSANIKTIRSSYRNLVKKYHPDVVKDEKVKERLFFEDITAAYNTLIHPDKRKNYDLKLDGMTGVAAVLAFPFREFRNWISSFTLYKMIFSGKQVSKPTLAEDPIVQSLSVDELLQRIIYSKNRLLQIHSVRALLSKESHYAFHDLLRLLYTGINEEIKVEIIKGLDNPHKSGIESVLREIYGLDKSEAVRSAIKSRIKI